MVWIFVTLLVIACVVLAFFVLIQNPKDGGLAGNVGGLSNQLMGVKQTTDVLEKGTWIFASVIIVLAITSSIFLSGKHVASSSDELDAIKKINTTTQPQQQPAAAPAAPAATAPQKK